MDSLALVFEGMDIKAKKRVRYSGKDVVISDRQSNRKRRRLSPRTELKLYCLFGTDSEEDETADEEDAQADFKEPTYIFYEEDNSVESLLKKFEPLEISQSQTVNDESEEN